ncbi:MAG TPA: c-type cytochrome [bacterium]|nr:c-type cytochrome [bacterium]
MADFKDERAYDSKTLTKVFLWSSLVLLICIIWMIWKDYNRPWKNYQRQFMQLQRSMAVDQKTEAISDIDFAKYKQLRSDLDAANKELKSHEDEIDRLNDQAAKLDNQIFKSKTVDYQPLKAQIDADKYTYAEENKDGKDTTKLNIKIQSETDQANAYTQKLFDLQQQRDQVTKDLADINAKHDEVNTNINKMLADYHLLKAKIDKNSFGFVFYVRNAMLLDFLSPTIQIQQVVLKNLPEDLYFAKTMRVDRCMTCHQAIDKKGFENAPEPFRTHPHLDLYVGPTSQHPMEKIGCTICHGGMGQAIDFTTCAHVPNDEEQAKLWKEKYGWEAPEGVQSTMLPLKYTEGSCLKCHGTQEFINNAPELDRGRELMVTRGCVGCHKVKNLEGLTKAGPSLIRVKGKLKEEFVEKWVWDPKSYNAAARMPSFFQQTNNSDDEALAKTKAELHSIVQYLYEHSTNYVPNESAPAGSVANGKKVFKEIGCLACHGIDDVTSHHADFAPDLSAIGSKLSASFVYTWIKNPRHFNPDTRMPVLRLTNQEAADVTAYLMSKKNKTFDEASAPQADPAVRDDLIQSYLKPLYGIDGAKTQLAQMDDKARDLFLGQKSISKYGCFGCHMIQGFETAQGIGTELSDWGTKQVGQLDFGTTDLEHTHEAFANAKLENPRQFDKDKSVAFQDRLKMPNFRLSPEDKDAIVTALLGLTKTYVPDDMTAGIHGNGPLLEKGRRVIANFNCRGCHLIEDQGGRIREMYEKENIDLSLAPPNLRKEGSKIQVEWFHDFLLNVHPIRPWLHIHMPSFHWSDEDISNVITYFNLKDDQVYPFTTIVTGKLSANELTQTKAMFAKLQCQKCHIFGTAVPADLSTAAPDLLQVHSRLKPDWVVEWLKNPEALMPGARMPSFWPQPEDKSPVPHYFHGDSEKQREALRDYLFMLGKAN